MLSRFLAKALFVGLFLLLCLGCSAPKQKVDTVFITITDSYDREVVLEKEPRSIISLSPAITEVIFELGEEERLVGISDFCTFPKGTEKIPKVGGLTQVNIERIISLNPDLVLIGSIISKKDLEKMEQSGLKVIALREESGVEGVLNLFIQIGKLVNAESLAQKKSDNYRKMLEQIKNLHFSSLKKVYYVVGFGAAGDFTAPQNSHIHEIITLAGGRNIGDQLKTWSVSKEYLFQEDPDLIFIRKEDFDAFISTHPYTELRAVKNKKVYPIESGWIDIVSPRNILAIQEINSKLGN